MNRSTPLKRAVAPPDPVVLQQDPCNYRTRPYGSSACGVLFARFFHVCTGTAENSINPWLHTSNVSIAQDLYQTRLSLRFALAQMRDTRMHDVLRTG